MGSRTDNQEFDARPVRAFRPATGADADESGWPASVPAMGQLLREGLELPAGLTVLVGENGSGKSTVVECMAEAYGLNPQGGSAQAQLFGVRPSEPGAGGAKPRWSYFLRADTMSQLHTYLEQNPGRRPERLHELSHGESFLEILRTRVRQTGFYLMDEPDAPLSFTASLGLAALLHDLAAAGSQAVVATHSPVVAAVPGAHLLELGRRPTSGTYSDAGWPCGRPGGRSRGGFRRTGVSGVSGVSGQVTEQGAERGQVGVGEARSQPGVEGDRDVPQPRERRFARFGQRDHLDSPVGGVA
ncbi:MAG: AAA family ATPase, partial [Streptosporangiaceae bacterium]